MTTKPNKPESGLDTTLIGKPIEELTPAELATLSSQLSGVMTDIETRQKEVRERFQTEVFDKIAEVAKDEVAKLGWAKLPKLTLVPDVDGVKYEVAYSAKKVRGTGKRAAADVNSGAVTINKIGIALGGIAWFKGPDGKEYEGIKELVKSLKHPDTGASEADRCWDISKKGISASDIVIKYHADEVTLILNDGTEKLVKNAVDEMKAARATA